MEDIIRITRPNKTMIKLYVSKDQYYQACLNHKILIQRAHQQTWTKAQDIIIGDKIV